MDGASECAIAASTDGIGELRGCWVFRVKASCVYEYGNFVESYGGGCHSFSCVALSIEGSINRLPKEDEPHDYSAGHGS